jgi:hypothetical protein
MNLTAHYAQNRRRQTAKCSLATPLPSLFDNQKVVPSFSKTKNLINNNTISKKSWGEGGLLTTVVLDFK